MKNIKLFVILFLLIVFVIGLFATMYFNPSNSYKNKEIENMEQQESGCPNMLVKKGQSLALYNTKQPIIEGKNPILFQSLDDYIGFVRIQEKNGINCPILY